MTAPWGRVIAFVDGFNVYHSVAHRKDGSRLKWLDCWKLCSILLPSSAELKAAYYFTAYFDSKPRSLSRHKLYVRALCTTGIETVFGKFKKRNRRCPICGSEYTGHEEKQTDVNIATKLLELAFVDAYDTALILSGDTDLIPAIRAVQRNFPAKRIGLCFPPRRRSNELKDVADFHMRLKDRHLKACQFPDEIRLTHGFSIKRPPEWT